MTVSEPTANPVPVVIYCPACQSLHIDEGEWATRPHKTHQCQKCKLEWRPFPYATVGVASRKHYHKAMYDDLSGVLLEDCAICGESWRSTDVHISNPSVAEPKTLAANCSQIARAEPSRGAPSWSKMMAEMQPCGHTNAQHLYHDSGDIKIDLSACLVHTSIEHAGQTSGGTTADVAKAASAAPEPSRGAPNALPCGCKADADDPKGPIFWNPFNGVVQCHKCGQSYDPRVLLDAETFDFQVEYDKYLAEGFADPVRFAKFCAKAYAKSGHVVLLEALREISFRDGQADTCGPNAPEICENDCDGCIARAAIQQAERT